MSAAAEQVAAHTRCWIERFVVGLELCPFAAPTLRDNTLRIAVCAQASEEAMARAVLEELDLLQREPEAEVSTSVLVFQHALADFDDYLDFLGLAEALLEECGLEGVVQIASFHPDYCFEGVPEDDVANASNRSPYPMLHFIREAGLTRALAHYPDPETIPQRNIDRLRALGPEAIAGLQARIRADTR